MDDFSDTPKLEPDDFYWSEEGYRVFTEKYHLKRGLAAKVDASTAPMAMIKRPE